MSPKIVARALENITLGHLGQIVTIVIMRLKEVGLHVNNDICLLTPKTISGSKGVSSERPKDTLSEYIPQMYVNPEDEVEINSLGRYRGNPWDTWNIIYFLKNTEVRLDTIWRPDIIEKYSDIIKQAIVDPRIGTKITRDRFTDFSTRIKQGAVFSLSPQNKE